MTALARENNHRYQTIVYQINNVPSGATGFNHVIAKT